MRPTDALRTPAAVTDGWLDLADPRDLVALDAGLADDFASNARGVVVRDERVRNDFVSRDADGKRSTDPHAVLGYLRTPAAAREVARFLFDDESAERKEVR